MKPAGGVRSAKSLFETFFVGEEGMQYFVKPLVFKKDLKEKAVELQLDFTFRYKNTVKDSCTINLSFFDASIIRNIDSMVISSTKQQMVARKINVLFAEKTNKLFNSRFTAKTSFKDLILLSDETDWKVKVYKAGTFTSYYPSQKTTKSLELLKDNLFVLFK